MRVWSVPIAVVLIACGGGGGGGDSAPSSPSASEDERGALGIPPTAADYCAKNGGSLDLNTSICKFPDGTSCEEWAFFYGDCGNAHSYCNQHGGTVSEKSTLQSDGVTTKEAVCNLNGKECKEIDFFQTGKCGQ
jgi:putative hemolysin